MLALRVLVETGGGNAAWYSQPVFIGVFTGIGVAVAGHIFAERRHKREISSSANLQKAKLENENLQANRKALTDLRQEIFVPFWDAISETLEFLGKLSTAPIEEFTKSSPVLDLAKQTLKIGGIMDQALTEPFIELNQFLATLYIHLFQRRIGIKEVENNIETERGIHARLSADARLQRSKYQALQTSHISPNEEENRNQFCIALATEFQALDSKRLLEKLEKNRENLIKDCNKIFAEHMKGRWLDLYVPVLRIIRDQLDSGELNEPTYRAFADKIRKQAFADVDELNDWLEKNNLSQELRTRYKFNADSENKRRLSSLPDHHNR